MPYVVYPAPRFVKLGRLIAIGKFRLFTCSKRMIFSLPLTMKYPPSSSDSSLRETSRAGELPSRWHRFDCLQLCEHRLLGEASSNAGASNLDHDGNLAKLSGELNGIASIDAVLKSGGELSPVCSVPLSALGRVDFSVHGQLVGWRHLRLLQGDILDPNVKFVSAFRRRAVVAIEENFCANVLQAVCEKAGLSIAAEDGVEGFNVRVDCLLESRIRGVILWRIAEEILATQSVELVVPFRAGG